MSEAGSVPPEGGARLGGFDSTVLAGLILAVLSIGTYIIFFIYIDPAQQWRFSSIGKLAASSMGAPVALKVLYLVLLKDTDLGDFRNLKFQIALGALVLLIYLWMLVTEAIPGLGPWLNEHLGGLSETLRQPATNPGEGCDC